MRWLVVDNRWVGAISRSSFKSKVVESLCIDIVALWALGSGTIIQVWLAGTLLAAVCMTQPGAPDSKLSLKLPVLMSAHSAFTVTFTVRVAVAPKPLRTV